MRGEADFVAESLPADAVAFRFSQLHWVVSEAERAAIITVERAGDITRAASVEYRTLPPPALFNCDPTTEGQTQGAISGVASPRCDFATTVGRLNFAQNERVKTFRIPLINDTHAEGDELFAVVLVRPRAGRLDTPAVSTVTITDDDAANNTNRQNPADDLAFFIRQHYLDFFSREASDAEVGSWQRVISEVCIQQAGVVCYDRTYLSGTGFFQSQEFQQKGYYVYRFYKLLGRDRVPTYEEFTSDMSSVQTTDQTARQEFAQNFAQSNAYLSVYPQTLTNNEFMTKLSERTGLSGINAAQLLDELNKNAKTRAQVLQQIAEADELYRREFNEAWVVMHYFAFLQRDGATSEYAGWKAVFDQDPNDWRRVSYGFITSTEYKQRFGDPAR